MASQICANGGVLGNLLLHRGWEVFPEVIPREKVVEWSKRIDGVVSDCDTPLRSFHGNTHLPSLVHCATAWEIRCATLAFFASLFNTDEHEVVLSADGLAVGSPSAHAREAWYGKRDIEGLPYWLHIDCDRRTLLEADHVDEIGEIQGYLCLRGGDYEGAHSTCVCSPKPGQSIASTMGQFADYFRFELENYPLTKSPYVYFQHVQGGMAWIADEMEFFKPFLQPGSLLLWRSLTPHCAHARGELGSRDPRLGLFVTASVRNLGARKHLVYRGEHIMTRSAVQGHDVFSRYFVCKGGNPLHFEDPVHTLVTRAAGCRVDKKIFDASLKSFQAKHGLPNKRAILVKTKIKTAARRRWRRGVLTSRCTTSEV